MTRYTKRPPGYELFFMPLLVTLDPLTCERIQFAYLVSKYGHSNQKRDDGTRYFDHPKGAAWIYINEFHGRDSEIIINTLLHDLSEDAYLLSPYRIAHNFGEERALDVGALTKLPKNKNGESKETTEEYLKRIIARGPRAIISKLLDRLHNLRSLQATSPEKKERLLEETKNYHIPMLIGSLRSCSPEMAQKLLAALEAAIAAA